MSKVSLSSGVPRVGTGPSGPLGSASLLSEQPRDWVRTQWPVLLSNRKKRVLPLTFLVMMGSWGSWYGSMAPSIQSCQINDLSTFSPTWCALILLEFAHCSYWGWFVYLEYFCFLLGPSLNTATVILTSLLSFCSRFLLLKVCWAISKNCDLFIPLNFSNFYNFLWISGVDWVRKAILIVFWFSGASGSMGVTSSNPPGRNPARDSWPPWITLDTFERRAGFLMTLSFWSVGPGGVFPVSLDLRQEWDPILVKLREHSLGSSFCVYSTLLTLGPVADFLPSAMIWSLSSVVKRAPSGCLQSSCVSWWVKETIPTDWWGPEVSLRLESSGSSSYVSRWLKKEDKHEKRLWAFAPYQLLVLLGVINHWGCLPWESSLCQAYLVWRNSSTLWFCEVEVDRSRQILGTAGTWSPSDTVEAWIDWRHGMSISSSTKPEQRVQTFYLSFWLIVLATKQRHLFKAQHFSQGGSSRRRESLLSILGNWSEWPGFPVSTWQTLLVIWMLTDPASGHSSSHRVQFRSHLNSVVHSLELLEDLKHEIQRRLGCTQCYSHFSNKCCKHTRKHKLIKHKHMT